MHRHHKTLVLQVFLLSCALFWGGAARPLWAADYKVYILAGQSNADGRAEKNELPTQLRATQTDVTIYYDDKYDGIVNNPYWQDLRPGLARGYGAPSGPVGYDGTDLFGPEITFGRIMADAKPDENIAIIKYTYGGTDLYTRWKSTDPRGDLYQRLLYHTVHALNVLENTGNSYTLEGMMWMQGEKDSHDYAKAQAYEQNMTDFINNIRTDIDGAEDMKFVLGQISATGSGATYLNEVQQAQYNVSQNMDNVFMVTTTDLPLKSDNVHLSPQAQQILGERFANQFLTSVAPEPGVIVSLGFIILGFVMFLYQNKMRGIK